MSEVSAGEIEPEPLPGDQTRRRPVDDELTTGAATSHILTGHISAAPPGSVSQQRHAPRSSERRRAAKLPSSLCGRQSLSVRRRQSNPAGPPLVRNRSGTFLHFSTPRAPSRRQRRSLPPLELRQFRRGSRGSWRRRVNRDTRLGLSLVEPVEENYSPS